MKLPVLPFALVALVVSSPGFLPASPFHSEHQLDVPAAAKRLADDLEGESRIVRLFYVLPEGRTFREEVVQKLKDEMLFIQAWFGEQMEAHGFGYTTFSLETDDDGQPLVYLPGEESPSESPGIQVKVVDTGTPWLRGGVHGEGIWWSKVSGRARVASEFSWQTLAHELGHAFGMGHDFRDDTYIMSYGQDERNVLSECAAQFLAVDPQFNPDVGVEWAETPTIDLLSPPTYPEGAQSVSIRLYARDAQGLKTLRLRVPTRWTHRAEIDGGGWELKLCRDLMGAEEGEVEIEYDGVIPSGAAWRLSDLSDPKVHPISLTVYNSDGNRTSLSFELWEVSRQHLATFKSAGEVYDVTFAPEGTALASGSTEGIGLWDLETRTGTTTSPSGATAVALTPDGGTLASANPEGEVQLLDLASGQAVATLPGHAPPIRSLAFSPDGTLLASGAADAIRLWDLAAQTSILLPVKAAAIAFSPDGERLASGSGAGDGVQLWDLATLKEVPLTPNWGYIHAVAFSPDGTLVASGGDDGTVKLWNVATGEPVAVLEGHGYKPVQSVAFSPDGTLLASGADLAVNLWDPVTKGLLAALQGEGRGINSVAFSPDGARVAAGTQDGKIGLWDVSQWRQTRPQTLVKVSGDGQQGTTGSALANSFVVEVRDQYDQPLSGVEVLFTVTEGEGTLEGRFTLKKATTGTDGRAQTFLTLGPDPGTNIVEAQVAGLDELLARFSAVAAGTPSTPVVEGGVQTWHLPDGAIARLGKGGIGRGDRVISFSPDGQLLAVGTKAGTWLYDVATSRPVALLPNGDPVMSVAFSPDGSQLVSPWSLWDVATGSQTPLEPFYSVAFSPDGTMLALGAYDAKIILWDLAAGTSTATYEHRGTVYSVAFSPDGTKLVTSNIRGWVMLWDLAAGTHETLEGHTDIVYSVAFSPDGTTFASGSDDHTVRLWDAETGTHIATLERHTSWVSSVAFSPDGETLASGSYDGTVRLWDVATRTHSATFKEPSGSVKSVAFSPEGTTLASVGSGGTVRLWEVETGSASTLAEGHNNWINVVAFSPDGATLASDGSMNVELWDVETGAHTATLEGHTRRINAVGFSPDGTILASGHSDGTVKLWEAATGSEIESLETQGWVSDLAFSPDGTMVASGHGNGTARLWDVATGANSATLMGHTYPVFPLAFSPDGATLASVGAVPLYVGPTPRIILWDVETGTQTASVELHTEWIVSLAFSPEMTPMVVGGFAAGPAELWDVAGDTRIATIGDPLITNGAISPDQTMFLYGSIDKLNHPTLVLWDIGAEKRTATLYCHRGGQINVVEFSPDGRFFASGSQDGTVLVWDLQRVLPHPSTLTKLAGVKQQGLADSTLAEPFVVSVLDQNGNPFVGATVTFVVTAGGGTVSATEATTDEQGRAATTLTLGSDPGRNTVTASVAELNPVIFGATGQGIPRALAMLSGDQQEGPAGTVLAKPFVVEVRDQRNNPLAGVQVAFRVTSGEGTLSVATDTTDAKGRAATLLTLGSQPGTNTVLASAAELYRATFVATGVGIPRTLARASGNEQQGVPGTLLPEPFVVSVLDQNSDPLAGATVAFAVTAGQGTLSATTVTTDENGRAAASMTLGPDPETVTVVATVAGLDPVTFTATAQATSDFDGDGETGFSDFFLFADAFGGSDPRFDLDGSGSVDFADFFLLADHFANPEARGKLLALARERIGLPDGPQLQQNAPNPFNSQTVISWFLLRPGPARVEVFALTGQRVAVLHQGPKKAGVHRVHWDGRDDRGRPLASGVYLYRLVTKESVQTRKLTLLR